jgi:hypothetical protein
MNDTISDIRMQDGRIIRRRVHRDMVSFSYVLIAGERYKVQYNRLAHNYDLADKLPKFRYK